MSRNFDNSKLIGGKRKNGHKFSCSCHICENMKNKAKRGGYADDVKKAQEYAAGSKKKNGHRQACICPICKNMKNSKKRYGKKSNRKTIKRGGGGGDDEEDMMDIPEEAEVKEAQESNEKEPQEGEKEEKEGVEKEKEGEVEKEPKGGRKKKRGNGHKANCKCPICKNMRKKKGGQPQEPDIENQIGDIEEGGIKATMGTDLQKKQIPDKTETPASDHDYDALDAAEKGEAGHNVVGGSRKRRKSRKRRGRKTRRHRIYH